MSSKAIIDTALAEGRTTLTEFEAKQLLAEYGAPVVEERTACDPAEASRVAKEMGFPVALKGMGARLTHKSERGLVRLNLTQGVDVLSAAEDVARAAGDDLEGFLVQPMLSGRREFVAGLFHDAQFGPVVMFGLGGVFTEALDDVMIRLAPLTRQRAGFMIDHLRSSRLLGPFRGEAAADREALIETLMALSRLASEHARIKEVDLNPLLVQPDGRVAAVDALVVLGTPEADEETKPPVDMAQVRQMFYPESVAFIGASAQFAKWGNLLFTNVLSGGFEGRVHLVNPKGGTIAGRTAHRSVTDIDEPVDLAVVTVPAAKVMGLLPEIEQKGIRQMILITSGFAETGAEGRRLEEAFTAEARRRGILVLGPNTMGLCNPHQKFYCLGSHVHPRPGGTAFVSQSGNMGVQLLSFAQQQGIGIRAFAGSGNEAMLTIEDALDTFAVDELTTTVLLYIESVKNGRRFFDSASQVSRKKPVVVLKGGRSAAGTAAASSHTGALATDNKVFEAACRQAGIVLASRPMDLLDLSAAFSSLPLPRGRRTAIMTLGGGWGVVTADLCGDYGLEVPQLDQDLIADIDQILPPYWSRSNPVDLVGETDLATPIKVMELLMKWDGCDAVINLGILGRKYGVHDMIESSKKADPGQDPEFLENVRRAITDFEDQYIRRLADLMDQYQKPILGVSLVTGAEDKNVIELPDKAFNGVYFPTPERAVKALGEMCIYTDWLARR